MSLKLATALVLMASCDAQVDGSYAGDALVRLRGVAVGFPADAAIDGAAVRWTSQTGSQLDAGPALPLPIDFAPPAVIVPIIARPPDDAMFGFAGEPVRIAEGTLMLTDRGAIVGEAIDFALVYIDGDVTDGSLAADYLGGVAAHGFHLCNVRATASLTSAQAYLAAQCGGTTACTEPRLYRLEPMPDDLHTELQFFRGAQ
jgi:hypothetical protein